MLLLLWCAAAHLSHRLHGVVDLLFAQLLLLFLLSAALPPSKSLSVWNEMRLGRSLDDGAFACSPPSAECEPSLEQDKPESSRPPPQDSLFTVMLAAGAEEKEDFLLSLAEDTMVVVTTELPLGCWCTDTTGLLLPPLAWLLSMLAVVVCGGMAAAAAAAALLLHALTEAVAGGLLEDLVEETPQG